jgi:hypothetical protein
MTRKDYVLIAGILNNSNDAARKFQDTQGELMLTHVAIELADALQGDNPRFDRARFLDACGVN